MSDFPAFMKNVGAGQEYFIPKGTKIAGRLTAGTRTIHAFGGTRAERKQTPGPRSMAQRLHLHADSRARSFSAAGEKHDGTVPGVARHSLLDGRCTR
jgi:hypothetical protein